MPRSSTSFQLKIYNWKQGCWSQEPKHYTFLFQKWKTLNFLYTFVRVSGWSWCSKERLNVFKRMQTLIPCMKTSCSIMRLRFSLTAENVSLVCSVPSYMNLKTQHIGWFVKFWFLTYEFTFGMNPSVLVLLFSFSINLSCILEIEFENLFQNVQWNIHGQEPFVCM